MELVMDVELQQLLILVDYLLTTYSGNTLTVNGLGAHLGLPKVTNTGEISSPSNAATSVSYIITLDTIANTLTADIDFGGGWWRYVYQKTSLPQPNFYNVTLKVNTSTITVGPNGMYAGGGVVGDAMAVPQVMLTEMGLGKVLHNFLLLGVITYFLTVQIMLVIGELRKI